MAEFKTEVWEKPIEGRWELRQDAETNSWQVWSVDNRAVATLVAVIPQIIVPVRWETDGVERGYNCDYTEATARLIANAAKLATIAERMRWAVSHAELIPKLAHEMATVTYVEPS